MNTEKVYILEDRGILFINGPDSEKFLQNLISNDIEKVNESKSCFASLLSPQGKFLFDFIVVKHKDGYFLDCEKRIIDQLYKKLVMYKLKSKIEILNLSNEFVIAAFSAKKFMEFASVSRRIPGPGGEDNAYQRLLTGSRLKTIGENFIDNGGFFANKLIFQKSTSIALVLCMIQSIVL